MILQKNKSIILKEHKLMSKAQIKNNEILIKKINNYNNFNKFNPLNLTVR